VHLVPRTRFTVAYKSDYRGRLPNKEEPTKVVALSGVRLHAPL